MKKQEMINSGSFTSGEGKKGNFNAYGAETGRFFVHKQLMETLGWKTNEDVKYPFYAIIEERELELLNPEGEKTGEKTSRIQASAIFKTEDEMLKAFTSSARFAVKADSLVAEEKLNAKVATLAKAKSIGLTEKEISQLAVF